MSMLDRVVAVFRAIAELPILKMGASSLTLGTFLYLVTVFIVLFYVTARLQRWAARRALSRTRIEASLLQPATSIIRYVVLVAGTLVVLQTAGIDVTTLNILAGTVGLGVGIGLQSVANNFVSGLVVLFERPIKLGDRIEVGDVEGDVVDIGARGTTVLTNDNISIIVPNSKFIAEDVVNWSHNDRKIRFRIPVPVAYGSNVRQVEQLLLGVAQANPDVLEDPPPVVRFLEFGDHALLFELRAWSTTLLHRKGKLTSDLNFAIWDMFRGAQVEIPFPQRDVHIRSLPAAWPAPSAPASSPGTEASLPAHGSGEKGSSSEG